MSLELQRARWADVLNLWLWRNEARDVMVDTSEVGLWRHFRWFAGAHRSETTAIYIGWDRLRPVGYARLHDITCSDDVARWRRAAVSIVVDPAVRRAGFGFGMLSALRFEAVAHKIDALYADIKHDNAASRDLFLECGYRPTGYQHVRGFDRFELRLWP